MASRRAAVDFIGWVSGRDPNLKTIFASFSDELGMRTNKELQRMLDNDRYRMLFPKTNLVTGSKETRANPFAAMVQNSGVLIIAGSWIQEFVREANFPNGKYDDQIDGCSGAFNRLAQRLNSIRRFVGSMNGGVPRRLLSRDRDRSGMTIGALRLRSCVLLQEAAELH